MSLIAPIWLVLSALGIVVLILHVRRRRTFEIPSIQLWQLIDSGALSGQRIRLPSPNLLLVLQLLVVALTALALARPLLGSGPRFAHEIVVLDASGGMRSTDVAPSRFDAAVAQLAGMAAGPIWEAGARVSLLLAGPRPQILAARLAAPDGLAHDLELLRAGDGEADWTEVVRLASSVVKDGEPTRLTLITDSTNPGAARLSAALPGVIVETRIIGTAAARNARLRASLRAVDARAGKWRAEGSVRFSPGFTGSTAVTALVQPDASDGFLEWGSVDVVAPVVDAAVPGRPREAKFALDLDLRVPSAVVLQLPNDEGPQDNSVQFVVYPTPRVLKILQLGAASEPLTRALKAAAEVEVFAADALPADISAFDLVVANGIELARRPATNVLWLGAARVAGEAGSRPRGPTQPALWQTDHPLSKSMSWGSIMIGSAYGFPRLQGADAIMEAGGAPLVEARTTLTGREVRIAFDLGGSNWPDEPSFPIFVSNLLHWIAPDLGRTIEAPCIVGTSCVLDPRLLGAEATLVTAGLGPPGVAGAAGEGRGIACGASSPSPQSKSAVADFDHSVEGPKPAYTRFRLGEGRGGGSGGCGTAVPYSPTPTPDPSPAEPRYSEGSALQQSDRNRQQPTSVGGGEKRGCRAICDSPAALALPAVPSAAGFLPHGYDAQFIPDRAGIYRLKRDGLTRLVAVNAPSEENEVVQPQGGTAPIAAPGYASRLPLWWCLLVAIFVLLMAEGWLAGRGPERFLRRSALAHGNPLAARRRLLLAARLAALSLVGLAIAGVPLPMLDRSENIVVVAGPTLAADAGGAGLPGPIAAAADRHKASGGDPRLGVVAIDAKSHVAVDLGAAPDRNPATDPSAVPTAADLEHALAVAAAMLPAGAPGRIVVAFDGNETRGNAARVLPAVVGRGVKIDVLPMTRLTEGEVLVEEVTAPERVYAGDSFALQAVVYSHGPSMATVQVLKDGDVIVERPVEFAGGHSRIETIIPTTAPGRARYEAVVSASGDTLAQNNRNGIVVDVAPAPQVLIVAAQPAWAEVFAKALAVHDIKSKIVEPKRAPFYLKDWLAYSAIVLMNVPAIDLTTLQQELIEKTVAEHGRGLLLLGGENSFGPGGYYETPLERVSPLSSRVPRDAPRVALVFVLDRSGSMQRNEGGATRLDIAKQATVSAIRLLHPESQIAIVVFDSEAKVLLPLRPARDSAAVAQALQELEPGGGTAIYPGLVEALHQFEGVDAMAKHIVVMSDGLTQPGDFPGILKAISEQGISVSTVAIGDGADPVRLEEIARIGKGAFHATQDFKALPSILSQEALLLSGKPVEERSTTPSWVARNAEFFAGLPDQLPPLAGYVLTSRKPQADLHLVVPDEKQEPVPLFASWRYGNGRVVALTTQGAGAWTKEWQAMAQYPLLWSQTLRHVFPGLGEGLFPRLTRHGDDVEVDVDALNQEGAPRQGLTVTASLAETGEAPDSAVSVALSEVSPGRYRGRFTLERAGEFNLRAVADQTSVEAPLLVAYPALYEFTRADPDRLAVLAGVTGGRVLTTEEQIFAGGGEQRWVVRALWQVWVLAALALFMTDLIIRYASGLIGTRRRRPSAA